MSELEKKLFRFLRPAILIGPLLTLIVANGCKQTMEQKAEQYQGSEKVTCVDYTPDKLYCDEQSEDYEKALKGPGCAKFCVNRH